MGSHDRHDEEPIRLVRVRAFAVALTPVTNAEYACFLEATGHEPPGFWGDPRFTTPDCPVVGVSWLDAVDYCAWLSEVTGYACRLPTEAEREYAARGGVDGMRYHWGDEPWGRTCTPSGRLAATAHTPLGRRRRMATGSITWATTSTSGAATGTRRTATPVILLRRVRPSTTRAVLREGSGARRGGDRGGTASRWRGSPRAPRSPRSDATTTTGCACMPSLSAPDRSWTGMRGAPPICDGGSRIETGRRRMAHDRGIAESWRTPLDCERWHANRGR